VLRPGGRLLIENNNLAELLPRWLPAVVVERDGDFMIDRSTFEPATGRAVTERTCVRDGQVRRFTYSVRMFIAVELKGWLLAAGFDSVDQVDYEGAALAAGSGRTVSPRHIGVAGQGRRSSGPRLSPLATGPAQLARSAKDRPRQRKDIMGRKDVTDRREGGVADLPAVKVRGIAVRGIAAGGVALRALATGAFAAGAAAIGAFAIGAVAVGRLRVGNAAAKKLSVGRLEVDELVIGGKPVRVEDVGPVIGSA
jgi:hypothetical protein